MSSGRFPYPLILGALLACGPACAQEPAGGEASSWTDPPARTAPQEPEKAPPAAPAAEGPRVRGPESRAPEPARAERPPEPAKSEPAKSEPTKSEPAKTEPTQAERRPNAPTQAERREEQIRRAVDRSTAEREAEARGVRVPRRSVVERPLARRLAARPRRFSERLPPRLHERQVVTRRSIRRPIYGYADPVPVGPMRGRSYAGPPVWDEGPRPDDRARRITQARSAGYLVMRSRSYAYPDGTVVRRFAPLGADEFDD